MLLLANRAAWGGGVPELHHLGHAHYFAGLEADSALVYSQLLGRSTDNQPWQLPKQLQLVGTALHAACSWPFCMTMPTNIGQSC